MSIRLTVQFTIQPGKAEEFIAAAREPITRVRAEDKGCEMYSLFRSVDDDTRFVMVESWDSEENLAAHGSSPAVAEMAKIAPFMAGPPTLHQYED